jgi:AraC-like DNA-binding protein
MVSDHFKISPPSLQKLIKNSLGKTFSVYVEQQRLQKAREMLAAGNHTIHEIAGNCGFTNTNSFYKAFRRTFGLSPSEILNKGLP